MVKKTIYTAIAIAITIGAAYSYDRVRFGDQTVVFFRWVLGGEDDQRFARGRRGFDGGRGFSPDSVRVRFDPETSRRNRWTRPGGGEQEVERSTPETRVRTERSRDDASERFENLPEEMRQRFERFSQERGEGGPRPGRESRGRGGRHGRGSDISLREVMYYALILSFATMATYLTDQAVRKATRAWHVRKPT